MKRLYIFLTSLLTVASAFAQQNPGATLSPSGGRYADIYESAHHKIYAQMQETACFHTIQKQRRADTSSCSTAEVSVFGSAGELDGDFLVYQGNGSRDAGVYGYGVKDYDKYGILYSKAFYASGNHTGISWNAMRFPELYLPYIITDSTGGDSKYETYCAQGGYARRYENWHFGFDFSFYGEQAWRLTDPRSLNNVTFLTFQLSAGKFFDNGNSLWLNTYYTRNKQYLHDRYWRPGEQQRFFVIYGFGLYDNKESVVAFGVSRMYYINNTGVKLSYLSPENRALKSAVSLGYDFKKMYTEESDIVKLYNTRNHSITPEFSVSFIQGKWLLRLSSLSEILMRKGYENILERYMTDVANSTYDYRKIAEEQNYKFSEIKSQNSLRVEYSAANNHKIGVEAGANVYRRIEKNVKYHYDVENLNITPTIKTDYKVDSRSGKHSFSAGILYGRQCAIKHNYDVEIRNTAIPHVDFQTCFAPYAYFAAEFGIVAGEMSYQYNFTKFSVGLRLCGFISSGSRIDDAKYDKSIGYNSVCPMIAPAFGTHDEKWINASLFIKF